MSSYPQMGPRYGDNTTHRTVADPLGVETTSPFLRCLNGISPHGVRIGVSRPKHPPRGSLSLAAGAKSATLTGSIFAGRRDLLGVGSLLNCSEPNSEICFHKSPPYCCSPGSLKLAHT